MKNMKIIYAGIIIPLMLASVFIGFVSNDVLFEETKDLSSVIDKLTGNQAQDISEPELPPKPVSYQEAFGDIEPEIPINTWKEGESVKVDYDFASFTLDYSQSDWVDAPTNDPPSPKRLLEKLGNALVDDGNDAYLQFVSDQESTTHRDIFRWVIPISENVPRTGTIYLESGVSFTAYIDSITHVSYYFLRNDGLGHTVHSLDVTSPYDTKDITLDIADYIQEDGKIYGKISIEYDTDANNNDHKLFVSIDHFCYTPDSVTEHVRSEYLYSSGGAISQQLDFWNPSSSDIEIFLPLNWDSIEISPIIDYSLDSDNTMEILGVPGNTFFTLRASQNSSKQYLAISTEKTYDMEGELPDHQIITSSTGYDGDYGISDGWSSINYKGDNTLNSTIVSNGAFSLRMDGNFDSPNYRAYLGFYVPYGEYYFSFDYYVESSDGTLAFFEFFIAGSGTVVSALTLDQTANRWHKGFAFGNCKYTYYSQAVICVRDTSDFVVFFDNIQFLKVNHQQETIDYSQTLFSGQLNSWTSKGLIPMPFEEINLELRDRTGDSSIKAIETMTDSQGFFYWNFQGKLLEKEYEFRSWSYNSWFGSLWDSDITESTDDWGVDAEISTDSKIGEYSIELDGISGEQYDPSGTWDFSNVDYYVLWIKVNETAAATMNHYWMNDWSNYGMFQQIDNYAANTWYFETWEYSKDWVLVLGTLDITTIGFLHWNLGDDTVKWLLDGIHCIQAQKSYFTPLTTGSIDYAINEQENNPLDQSNYWGFDGWDWREEVTDLTTSVSYCTMSYLDGYAQMVADNDGTHNYARYGSAAIEPDILKTYWTHISMRVWSNTSNTAFYFKLHIDGVKHTYSALSVSANTWTILEWETGVKPGVLIESFSSLYQKNTTGGSVSLQATGKIDWLRLEHRDSDLEKGYSWEFNENDFYGYYGTPYTSYGSGWGCLPSRGSLSIENGYAQLSSGGVSTYTGLVLHFHTDPIYGYTIPNPSDYDYIWIRAKASHSDLFIDLVRNGGNTGDTYNYGDIYFSTSWQDYFIDLNSNWDNSGNLVCLLIDETDGTLDLNEWILFDFFRLVSEVPPNLYETQTDLLLENEGFLDYITFTDSIFSGYYANMDFIGKNMSIGSHSFIFSGYYDYLWSGVTLPSVFYQYDYDIDETGIMKVIIHDQSGNVIPFDSMEVYIDSTRLYDNFLYFSDVSQTFNLTVTDLFENMLYQDTTEDFENFKEIQITLHSVKIQNLQENPIWVQITRDSKNYSEWIYSYEIIEYRLEAATYGFTVYYCDSLAGDIGALSTNGSWVYLEYAVSADSAIMITGETIKDVWNNVISLSQDLIGVNASLSNQIIEVEIHVSNVNTSITNQVVSVEIFLDNVNTTIGTQLLSIETDINNVNTTLYAQTVSILTQIANTNSTLYAQDLQIISDIQNVNATLYAQDMTILTNISNTNSTLHAQNIAILQDLAELKGIYRVHFSVIDGAGIGLPFETVLLNVNGSRHFDQDVYLSNNTYFEAEAFDWFDVSLWSDSFSITKQTEVNISIQLYWVLFENNGSYTSYLEIWRNNKLGVNITVAPDQTVSIRLTEGVYDYRVYYFKNDSQETTTKDPSIYSYGKSLLSLGKFAVSALMPTKINVSTPKIKLPLLEAILEQLTLVEIIANVVLTVLGLAASYFVLNFIVRRAIGRHAQDPSYVPPRERDDWLDKLEKKAGLNTDDEGLW